MLGLGLLFKLLFLFIIGPHLFGPQLCESNDSFSYTLSFINLVKTGTYTHNPAYEPAAYGRLPGVPFLWGTFYLLFGLAASYKAFACFQFTLDIAATVFVYRMVSRYSSSKTGWLAAAVYTFFPLITFFAVKTGVEYLTVFFTISIFYCLVFYTPTFKKSVVLGLLITAAVFVKETLLLLVPLSFFFMYRNSGAQPKHYVIVGASMLLLYLPWPLRNYARSGSVVLTKPIAAGYSGYKEDMISYMFWMYAWHNSDMMAYFDAAYNDAKPISYPGDIFNTPAEQQLAYDLVRLGRRCSPSFAWWKNAKGLPPQTTVCNHDRLIGRGFDLLREHYIRTHPFNFYVKIPLQNLAKALFKNSLAAPGQRVGGVFTVMMVCRTLLLFAGLLGCLLYWKNDFFKISFIYFVVMYVFICGVFRQVEMRYLLPADVLMLIAAACLIGKLFLERNSSGHSAQQ